MSCIFSEGYTLLLCLLCFILDKTVRLAFCNCTFVFINDHIEGHDNALDYY